MVIEPKRFGTRMALTCFQETERIFLKSFRKSALLSRKLCHWAPPLTGSWSHSMRAVTRALMPFRMPVPRPTLVFFVFDVLVNRWRDVKHLALSERLPLLQSAVVPSERVKLSEHFAGPVSRFVSAVRQMGGEGVVAKRLSSHYEPGKRTGAWSKMRLNVGQEFVIGGFTPGSHGVDALVVGFHDGDALIYAARVRAGLVPATRRELQTRLKALIIGECPFTNLPELKSGRWGQGLIAAKMQECIWLKPKLVANCEFLEWTDSNHVRHIKFVGLRTDKNPRQVVRE